MKEAKFTPGPWHVTNGMPFIQTQNHKDVCKINCDIYQEGDFNIIEANARLISYSPNMYEALEAAAKDLDFILNELQNERPGNYKAVSTLLKINELLTKIKGE